MCAVLGVNMKKDNSACGTATLTINESTHEEIVEQYLRRISANVELVVGLFAINFIALIVILIVLVGGK